MKLTCGLTTHSYDYIHYNNHNDAFDAMIENNIGDNVLRQKKMGIEEKVRAMNQEVSKLFNEKTTGVTEDYFKNSSTNTNEKRSYLGVTDYTEFAFGEQGIAGVQNLAVQLLRRTDDLNSFLKFTIVFKAFS